MTNKTDKLIQQYLAKIGSKEKPPRGIYEKQPGSGVWWIRYADNTGRIRREKAGNKSVLRGLQ